MLLAVLISTLVQIMYMADVMTAFFTVYVDLVLLFERRTTDYLRNPIL